MDSIIVFLTARIQSRLTTTGSSSALPHNVQRLFPFSIHTYSPTKLLALRESRQDVRQRIHILLTLIHEISIWEQNHYSATAVESLPKIILDEESTERDIDNARRPQSKSDDQESAELHIQLSSKPNNQSFYL